MKIKLLFATCLIALNAFAQKEVKTYYDYAKTKIKEKYFVNATDQKNGLYIQFDDRGLREGEMTYTNGRPNGISKEYYLPFVGYPGDEKVSKIVTFVNGNREGLTTAFNYLKDGKQDLKNGTKVKTYEEYYKNDKAYRAINYFPNGKISIDSYLNNGTTKEYYEDGKPLQFSEKKNGAFDGAFQQWYDNGILKLEGVKKNGEWIGSVKEYYSNGKLWHNNNFIEGDTYGEIKDGEQIEYDSTGALYGKSFYTKILDDQYKSQVYTLVWYYPNGNVYSSGSFIKTRTQTKDVNNTGVLTTYYESGKVERENTFLARINGREYRSEELSIKRYTEDGLVCAEGNLKNDKKIGKWTFLTDKEMNTAKKKEDIAMKVIVTYDDMGNQIKTEKFDLNGNIIK